MPVVSQRRSTVGRGGIVPARVYPASFIGVGLFPVQFNYETEFLVAAVAESPAPVRFHERDLMLGNGQTVRALDVTVITEFEHRMRASRRSGDDFVELAPPAEFLADVHRGAKWPFTGESSPEGAGYPSADMVQVTGHVHEVENCLLHKGVRENAAREACPGVGAG